MKGNYRFFPSKQRSSHRTEYSDLLRNPHSINSISWFSLAFLLLFFSTINLKLFAQDVTPPAPVTIRFVDVNPNNNDVTVRWNASSSVDVAGYYIYKNIDGYWIRIGETLVGTTLFVNDFVNPPAATEEDSRANTQIENYRVSAHDGPNESVMCDPHHTIYLQSYFDSCQGTVVLSWNHYDTWSDGLLGYEVYTRKDGGAEELIAFILPSGNSFVHRTIEPESTYWYYVKAISGSAAYTSRSNARQVFTDMPRYPIVFNANFATILSENRIGLNFKVDLTADVIRYKILRASDGINSQYDTIATINPNNLDGDILNYEDNINTNQVHYYKLVAINTCNVPFYNTSNVASNMLSYVKEKINMENVITWTNYLDWRGGIDYYEVYRQLGNDLFQIGTVEYGDSSFVDDLKSFLLNPQYALAYDQNYFDPSAENVNQYMAQPVLSGKVCYYIVAVETDQNPFNVIGESKSTTTCIDMQPNIWIPNAFSPNSDGINDYWVPYVTFVGWDNYFLQIYDRFGNIQFQTNSPKQAWDGRTAAGDRLPSDMYRYLLQITKADGETIQRSGAIMLIK